MIRVTAFEVSTLPPFSSITRANASGRRIEPPSGRTQLKRCRPATRENACRPVSGSSSGCSVMNAIQAKKAHVLVLEAFRDDIECGGPADLNASLAQRPGSRPCRDLVGRPGRV